MRTAAASMVVWRWSSAEEMNAWGSRSRASRRSRHHAPASFSVNSRIALIVLHRLPRPQQRRSLLLGLLFFGILRPLRLALLGSHHGLHLFLLLGFLGGHFRGPHFGVFLRQFQAVVSS